MTASKEKGVVEIKFVPREQENTPGNQKLKEEKKEVFTKVGRRVFWDVSHCLRCVENKHGGSFQHRGQRRRQEALLPTVGSIHDRQHVTFTFN